ncbi:MAG: hypothetical protein KAI84_20720, partial [Gammaproteobacteria bacterium]|nr:hypothetical protein [Gammaproteobacteria bacterium]
AGVFAFLDATFNLAAPGCIIGWTRFRARPCAWLRWIHRSAVSNDWFRRRLVRPACIRSTI